MTDIEVSTNIHDHGAAVDALKKKFKCNYCSKVVSSISRLKYHLGGIRGDVVPCVEVPTNVKEVFRSELLEKKRGSLKKEVGQLNHPNLPWKRNICDQTNCFKLGSADINQTVGYGPSGSKKRAKMDASSENSEIESVSYPKRQQGTQAANSTMDESSLRQAQRSIARFFYETGIDFDVARTPSFQRMINATLGHGQVTYKIPTGHDFKGWILQDELQEMQHYVQRIRNSWASTGCSILLDGWVDGKGRNLMHIVADCALGAIYVGSFDISAFIGNVDAMVQFFEGILKDIGIENVVQIITYSASAFMEALGKQLMDKHRTLFWTVSASHCIELMLEKFSLMDDISETLEDAKIIFDFICSRASVLKLLKNYTSDFRLNSSTKAKSVLPFLALENIVLAKEGLKEMFTSPEWSRTTWAATTEGRQVAYLVAESPFWIGAMAVLKAAIPLVRVLDLINKGNMPQLGVIYETIDQAKETIKEEFNKKKSKYMRFWNAIDDIWNKLLHSPLHSAGYFLNPTLFYSSDFYTDAEVASGLLCCIVRMTKDQRIQDLITLQVEEYRAAKGTFGQGSARKPRSDLPPAKWWTEYGGQCPELQRLAIRILSQTCSGASRYMLKRSQAERLLIKGRSQVEQLRLNDMTFIHYNLRLKNFEFNVSNNTVFDEIEPTNDYIADRPEEVMLLDDSKSSSRLDCGDAFNVEGSSFQPQRGA